MRIVVGVGDNQEIIPATEKIDSQVFLVYSEQEFCDLLRKNEADAFIRGSLGSSYIIQCLKESYGNIYRASFIQVKNHKFLLAPVGIDEGDTIIQKKEIINYATKFLEKIGIKPHVAVLSGGRPQDQGRSTIIDDSIAEGERLTRITRNKYLVEHYYILIEEAVKNGANLILAPNGICGNLIFRTLAFLCSEKSHGAITLGIDQILVDTSRSQNREGYYRALKFAQYLVNQSKKESE